MDNTTALTFTMTVYAIMENHRNGFFFLFLLLYVVIVFLNGLLISLILQNKPLQQPMNVFVTMLCFNEIYGSSSLLPSVMSMLLTHRHEISVKWCTAQVFLLHTYASAEFCILALMGYDRFAAICYPLHYNTIMSHPKMMKLVVCGALYPFIVFGSLFSLTIKLRFCGKTMPKLYCVNMELVKNACSNTSHISIVGLVFILFLLVPQISMIAFSYGHIARVCKKLSKQSQSNALKTCIPHLLSLLNYTIGSLFEIIQARFNMSRVSVQVRIFLSLYFVIIPSVANPVLYGMGSHIIRVHIMKLLIKHRMLPSKVVKKVITA
ncbi:olfactory receptor 52D1-like [Entelurus aequoreus]|uniref:olfactory receptor 52D1-like n=1 Tax=Entelurus aequoreus TaxID=161455 RepID=UPI002B1D9293|nr:olfactory receptor 52D1-like [Entelurus aequoreus]XP_061903864.1 olfactory receptor 52D1-like [Entelurus aequoreus]